jgi:creatinine amidohydrolase/Fe(II)-dependent formamide hydrolase-like protein
MAKRKSFYLHDMNFVDVAEYLKKCDVIMVAMGSLERHGAHIPLGCDALTTWEVVTRASEKASHLHPIIPYGYSPPCMSGTWDRDHHPFWRHHRRCLTWQTDFPRFQ